LRRVSYLGSTKLYYVEAAGRQLIAIGLTIADEYLTEGAEVVRQLAVRARPTPGAGPMSSASAGIPPRSRRFDLTPWVLVTPAAVIFLGLYVIPMAILLRRASGR